MRTVIHLPLAGPRETIRVRSVGHRRTRAASMLRDSPAGRRHEFLSDADRRRQAAQQARQSLGQPVTGDTGRIRPDRAPAFDNTPRDTPHSVDNNPRPFRGASAGQHMEWPVRRPISTTKRRPWTSRSQRGPAARHSLRIRARRTSLTGRTVPCARTTAARPPMTGTATVDSGIAPRCGISSGGRNAKRASSSGRGPFLVVSSGVRLRERVGGAAARREVGQDGGDVQRRVGGIAVFGDAPAVWAARSASRRARAAARRRCQRLRGRFSPPSPSPFSSSASPITSPSPSVISRTAVSL